jgi:hypothetical protein
MRVNPSRNPYLLQVLFDVAFVDELLDPGLCLGIKGVGC